MLLVFIIVHIYSVIIVTGTESITGCHCDTKSSVTEVLTTETGPLVIG